MTLRKTLLTLTCAAGLAAGACAGASAADPAPQQGASSGASETDGMVRASKFIGEPVRNGKGENIGTVDDLILNTSDRILFAVLSVGGFLGAGDRLVAVPFEELEFGSKDVEGVVVYGMTKERLAAMPAFTYADARGGASRERFMQSAERRVDFWQDRVGQGLESAKGDAKELKNTAADRVDSAWQKVQAEWQKLKAASADAWQSAKRKFDGAMSDLERAWEDATS